MQSPFFFWLVGYIRGWSSRLPRYDFLAFSRMIMFFSLTLIFSVLTCCWAFQYNSLIRSLFLPQNAFCLALPFHTPPTCLYTPWRTAYIPLVMNPRVVWLMPVNALRYYIRWFLWFEHRSQSRPIVCSLYDPQTTTTHPFEPLASLWLLALLMLAALPFDNICSHSFGASLLTHLLLWLFRLRGFYPITINLPMRWCLCLVVSTVAPPQTVFHSLDIYGFVFLCALSHFS